jgi:crossover junction endodeoxyribonuclease RuvC
MDECIIGIDVGLSGAIAIICGQNLIHVSDMPIIKTKTRTQIDQFTLFSIIDDMTTKQNVSTIIIEQVSAMPKQGVTSMFNFGMSYGIILGTISHFNTKIVLTTPRQWKKHFNLSANKDESRDLAMRLFPDHKMSFNRKKDDGRAEAALIALFHTCNC